MISAFSLHDGQVISILDVLEGRVPARSEFLCPCCRTPMLPVMGRVRRPHFRHRDLGQAEAGDCSPEGILHGSAKLMIATRVAEATARGVPYIARIAEPIACPQRKKVLGGECRHRVEQRSIDLAQLGQPHVEARRDPFRYDLLFETKGRRGLAVEIVVSAPVRQNKKAARQPLMEIRIRTEEDVAQLADGIDDSRLDISATGMEAHLGAPSQGCAGADCASRCLSFSVMSSGKVRLEEGAPFEACRPCPGRAHHAVFDSDQAFALSRFEALDRLTRNAYFRNRAPVRACLVCRHHEISGQTGDGEGPMWCNNDGRRGSVNRAADCLYFTPFASLDEARQHRMERRDGDVINP